MANDLCTLMASRICHDLISPLGAIGNGIELLELTAGAGNAEMDLIKESVSSAHARIKFFRVAFGAAAIDQTMSAAECQTLLSGISGSGRITYHWQITTDQPRRDVRMACLALLCLENALPLGGEITITVENGNWALQATGARLNNDTALWQSLSHPHNDSPFRAADIQFPLLANHLAEAHKTATLYEDVDMITLRF